MLSLSLLINVVITIVVVYLILYYLVPMLPNPFDIIVKILVILAVIIWLLRLVDPGLLAIS